jgi:hypothetical protein
MVKQGERMLKKTGVRNINLQLSEIDRSKRALQRVTALLMRYHQGAEDLKDERSDVFRTKVLSAAQLIQWMIGECERARERVKGA